MKIKRRASRTVRVGNVFLGAGHPVAIQSMVKVPAKRVKAAVAQIRSLQDAGCEIVRLAVEDPQDATALRSIKRQTSLPLVADIHFDYRLALAAIEAGVDKVRLNPGNIHRPREVEAVIAAARSARIPIRIGANSGSLRVSRRDKASALVQSVLEYLLIFKKNRFHDLVISLKGSDIAETIAAYRKMASLCDYPLHLGVTATGLPLDGVVKSSVGLGVLLFQGIGDTIRVSLLEKPEQEVLVARFLLNSLGLRKFGPELICCPTCGRCEVDLLKRAKEFQALVDKLPGREKARLEGVKVALMGCVVNGPGEAREADYGVAFSRRKAGLFAKGRMIGTTDLAQGVSALLALVNPVFPRPKARGFRLRRVKKYS